MFEDVEPEAAGSGRFSVLVHLDGGFRLLEPHGSSVPDEVLYWRREGLFPKVIRPASAPHRA